MATPDNNVPRTYRKPAFIPDGYIDVLGALPIVGKALFDDKWTGEEVTDRCKGEALQRRDQTVQWLRQSAYAGTISSKIITKFGTDHLLPKNVWAADTVSQIFNSGWAGFVEMAGYLPVNFEGHVLFCEREVTSALSTSTTTIGAERKCCGWLADKMRKGPPEKNKAEYLAEAKALFEIGSKAFLRAWGNALVDTDNIEWSKPGPKSIPPDQNPN